MVGDVFEMPALDVRSQTGREEVQIVQGDGHGHAVGRGGNADLVVGGGHLDREADDLPRRGQPLNDQRQRERQRLRRLQGGNVERGADCRDLRVREYSQVAGKPAVEAVQRFASLQNRADRQQILDHIGRTDAGQRALLVLAGHGHGNLVDRIRRRELEFTDRRLETGRRPGFPHQGQRRFEFACLVRRAVPNQPLPHRRQRGASNLTRPYRKVAVDEKRFERAEQQPRRIVGARPRLLVGSAHDLAQLFEHEGGDRGVLAAFDGALELPHQQGLRLRRKLREIVPQPLDRCLAHAPGMHIGLTRTVKPIRRS